MYKNSKRRSKTGSCLAVAALTLFTGCSQITAGTSPIIQTVSINSTEGEISYFNGDTTEQADITIQGGVPVWELDFKPDISMVPENDICTLICYHIDTPDPDINPIRAVAKDGQLLELSGEKFDGAGYALGNSWYGFQIPNGVEEYSIQIGNTLFNTKGR